MINERNGLPTDDYVTIGIRKPKNSPKSVPMICMNDVEQTEVDWLWYPYIPFGKLTIVQGNPGEGKTFFAMRLAAACTNKKFLPDMEPFEPFNMISNRRRWIGRYGEAEIGFIRCGFAASAGY